MESYDKSIQVSCQSIDINYKRSDLGGGKRSLCSGKCQDSFLENVGTELSSEMTRQRKGYRNHNLKPGENRPNHSSIERFFKKVLTLFQRPNRTRFPTTGQILKARFYKVDL